MHRPTKWIAPATIVVVAAFSYALFAEPPEIVYPLKDGTLSDGGVYGEFDGAADDADWVFDNPRSSYEGMITLTTESPASSLEQRVVWEYDLSTVTVLPPTSASLTFTIRGVSVLPFPDVNVHVYAYPSDLEETPDDFHMGPVTFQGSVIISPGQDPTEYSLDVSDVVNDALVTGNSSVAFRFQIDPDTPYDANQAFIDAYDDDPSTKPFLTIDWSAAMPGDFDGDWDVDLADYLEFTSCRTGPDVIATQDCESVDLDDDGDVDLRDFAEFQAAFIGQR